MHEIPCLPGDEKDGVMGSRVICATICFFMDVFESDLGQG